MYKALKDLLPIQEFDMQMIQLMHLKTERRKETARINAVTEEISKKEIIKENEVFELKTAIRMFEGEVSDVNEKIEKLESQQAQVKKVDEFNALSHEISQAERERLVKEQKLSDLIDKLAVEEETLTQLHKQLVDTKENSKILLEEIKEGISKINEEGKMIKEQRDALVDKADPEVFAIYEMLLKNKRDRIVVPIENRCCSGCHILLTAQHENLVRRGERLVFCEHCSRIHYWQESDALEGALSEGRRRRRRATSSAS